MSLAAIDRAVATVRFILKKRRKLVDDQSRKTDLSENQKIYIGQELELIQNVEVLIKQVTSKVDEQLGRVPPQATEIEEAVLGALMLEGVVRQVEGNQVSQIGIYNTLRILEPKHFHVERNVMIFEAIKKLFTNEQPIDMRTVVDQLRKMGSLEVVTAYYIAEITSKVSSAANIEYHSRILIEQAIRRGMILIAGKILNEAYNDTNDVFDILDSANEEMKIVNLWVK